MKKTDKRAVQEILEDEETITVIIEKDFETEIDPEVLAEAVNETIEGLASEEEVEDEEVVEEDETEEEETEEDLEEDIEDEEEDVEEDEEDIVEDEEEEIDEEEDLEDVEDEEIEEDIEEDEEVIDEEEDEEEDEDEEEEEEESKLRDIWNKKDNTEKRFFSVETRVSKKGKKNIVTGHAAVFGELSEDLGGFREIIKQGAFDNVLNNDVRAFFNHDPNFLLARSSSGTLKLGTDKKGLKYSFSVPDTTAGRDLLVSMKRGDITQSSFAFTVEKDSWTESKGTEIRTIEKVGRLFDVSPVSIPAYPSANDLSIAQRSRMIHNDKTKIDGENRYEYKRSLLELKINILKRK
tara:strand:- start:270 stop:1319 length:1050 start_codon:yes stop_codon:yes gene_type:complete